MSPRIVATARWKPPRPHAKPQTISIVPGDILYFVVSVIQERGREGQFWACFVCDELEQLLTSKYTVA